MYIKSTISDYWTWDGLLVCINSNSSKFCVKNRKINFVETFNISKNLGVNKKLLYKNHLIYLSCITGC